jgi:hypothetical protein
MNSSDNHVCENRVLARNQRVVELHSIEALAYVDMHSGDLTIAAKSPEALKSIIDRTLTPDTVIVNDTMPKSNTWTFDNSDGHAALMVTATLTCLGVSEDQILNVTNLLEEVTDETQVNGSRSLLDDVGDTTVKLHSKLGQLAKAWCKKSLPLQVLESRAGFYIGTADEDGPCSRESVEYFSSHDCAQQALSNGLWTQKDEP